MRSAQRLGDAVDRLRDSGTVVVVGTCPDLGVVTAIPQPLRTVVREWGQRLAHGPGRRDAARRGHPGCRWPTCSPRSSWPHPTRMFSADRFHPSAAGYELAASRSCRSSRGAGRMGRRSAARSHAGGAQRSRAE